MKTIYTLTLGLLVLLSLTASTAAAPPLELPVPEVATGGGFVIFEQATYPDVLVAISFTAVKDRQGDVTGKVQITGGKGVAIHADVYDLEVMDNKAIIASTVTSSNEPGIPLDVDLVLYVLDGGEGNNALDSGLVVIDGVTLIPPLPFEGGNIQVR